MDQLVKMHRAYIKQVAAFCMLDAQGKLLARELYTVISLVLEFRLLIQSYLVENELSDDSDNEMKEDSDDRVGALCVTSPDFYSRYTQCEGELNTLR